MGVACCESDAMRVCLRLSAEGPGHAGAMIVNTGCSARCSWSGGVESTFSLFNRGGWPSLTPFFVLPLN